MQRQSIVLWQTDFHGHIITVLDTTQAILDRTEQTGIGSEAINLYEGSKSEREKMFFNVSLHHTQSHAKKTWLSSSIFSDVPLL